MSELAHTTSTGQQPAPSSSHVALSPAVTIRLEPDLELVQIGDRRVRAFDMSTEQGVGESDGYIGFFKVQGQTCLYEVQLYEDHATVGKWWTTPGDPPFTSSDVIELTSVTAFAQFALKELIPDWEAALNAQVLEGS